MIGLSFNVSDHKIKTSLSVNVSDNKIKTFFEITIIGLNLSTTVSLSLQGPSHYSKPSLYNDKSKGMYSNSRYLSLFLASCNESCINETRSPHPCLAFRVQVLNHSLPRKQNPLSMSFHHSTGFVFSIYTYMWWVFSACNSLVASRWGPVAKTKEAMPPSP